jgi:hypothetical protein
MSRAGDVLAAPTLASGPRRWHGPAVVAVGAALAGGLLFSLDPNQPGHYPLCPFRALTGLDCPGCGSLRALHSLVHGDVVGALDHNALTVLAVPLLVMAWVRWARREWRGGTRSTVLDGRVLLGVAALFLVFAVVRNLPGVPFLGSGVG